MIGVDIAIIIIGVACLVSTYRILQGPTEADRANAGDLLFFGIIGLIALYGVRTHSPFTYDILIIATLVGFLGTVSLARALTRGKR
ncbi:monovalent cation/H+ antiporter complex subunit F [Jonesia denitrificans]|uniref:Multiple resistance and pH regulation protein F n=1 Tax=Jonesia denitrificans (strain ATCC 14870 / DSM 20603 / BCRC 15368 / CIP 55.134 / JCM 11481 / NBRC 15587 / NCTC 10816 / Prevot 55134) TaxID=471856 RepID=C7R002_JONDD|nr:monovalent cation/H+ antiporter complex subunit F [Jonesia denitrificans]ACV09560.1 multiple resistance and pH regulation protein F [Jonesia denitrificans DSM 20603]ASE09212.1 pesticidal protein Cry26Aa [Jonesia denitrificans]QXB43754.1 pesticidal protein Cry26Aa [Jonesia denitrificans]SQH21978.1 putative monovalent cation/H+ antiporter subunit F [Jonesia denitrificans]